jgi:branched-chain amino acid transport system ATP-binding protein/urea transport system ATP-binding protein
MLSIENLDAFYGKAHVLHRINISVDRGDLLAILGRNGVGKTTLLKAIMGIEVVRRGKIMLRGENISGLKTHEIARLGVFYIPDDTGLFQGMTVLENLRLATGRKNIDPAMLEEIYPDIRNLINRRADLLSGGERKIVSILRSIVSGSELILIDEPTEGVMPIMVRKIYSLLNELRRKGKTIVLVEPGTKLNNVLEISTKIAIMSGGRIVYINDKDKAIDELEIIRKQLFV